ncbi:40-residue YVTN family beta-propeller repeat-containing protein [Micromonospora pattaloongensis]|uniref:40-residue YVTN family beta-propeller repeat-containing protein n=1 Tax=Micromonospora pattaloongensis TaxID=405436 RepID=A0A1H3JZ24_9ACTN|nr:beta-propeller fold lactonase family protein [Micromonospora pattaloongensis]SDY45177.1 40-residue YVTN family beta-propeller repeat-containing protein [Micromonospora pattaloongensis]
MSRSRRALLAATVALPLFGCVTERTGPAPTRAPASNSAAPPASATPHRLPGMPPDPDPRNVYAPAGPNMLSDQVRGHRNLVYVPHTVSNDVYVIDPTTYKVVDKYPGGEEAQHIVPSYDLSTLYVASSKVPGGGLVPIDPKTGKPGKEIKVEDVYNLYFTPDGKYGMVVAEFFKRLDFYDPKTWKKVSSAEFPDCAGINHVDFTADGRTMLVSCEFANRMIAVDTETRRKLRAFTLDKATNGMPQDTRLTPDGRHFLVADMHAHGVYVFDGAATRQTGFIPTGRGAHGIYFSRDGRRAFVSNRDEGSISVLDTTTLKPVAKWQLPGGGSPDMGGLSADGKQLWLAGRYHGEVYVIDTDNGRLITRIPVGNGPHGLVVWPQPGRYSLGHTGNIR